MINQVSGNTRQRIVDAAMHLFWEKGYGSTSIADILGRAARVGSEAVHLHLLLATEEQVRAAHAAGYRVNVYTVDDPDAQRRLARFGVDGIFTNLPGKLRANLAAH